LSASDHLELLYLDSELVAINKPAGLLVHPSRIDRHERRTAMHLLRDQLGCRVYPLHRLDKPTSGALLFARSKQAAARMGERFGRGEVVKTYLAVVRGHTDSEGSIDHPLREQADPMTDARACPDKGPQPAITSYRRLATVELPYPVPPHATGRYSLLAVQPQTGRKHQIRRHLKHIAHPVIGDTTHGKADHNRLFRERLDNRRLLLAATELRFPHPFSDRPCRIVAPLARDFAELLGRLGWLQAVPAPWLPNDGHDAVIRDYPAPGSRPGTTDS
jgi:tRNA pseudouridine65 synthase